MKPPAFAHKKSLGQHFLNSDIVPKWLCDAANIKPKETVLEIGPGTGALTKELLARGATVIALETDKRALAILEETFAAEIAASQLKLHHEDVRELNLEKLGLKTHQFQVVANIPYYLSGFLFRTLLENVIQPNQLVFLVQKEVAKRATSSHRAGEKESILSLAVQVFGEPTYVRAVSRGHFNPPPKVESAIIAIRNIHPLPEKAHDRSYFFTLLHTGFGQKRKQLRSNLRAHFDETLLSEVFTKLDLILTVRAEDLSLENWLNLADALYPHYKQ